MDKDTKKKDNESPIWGLAYISTIGAALYASWVRIRSAFLVEFRSTGEISDISTKLNEDFKSIRHIKGKAYVEQYQNLAKDFSQSVTARVKEKGFENSYKKFKSLGKNNKFSVIVTFISVASVGIGLIQALKGNKDIEKKLDELKSKEDQGTAAAR